MKHGSQSRYLRPSPLTGQTQLEPHLRLEAEVFSCPTGVRSGVVGVARLNVDVTDPGFWELGLRLLDEMVGRAEKLAEQLKI